MKVEKIALCCFVFGILMLIPTCSAVEYNTIQTTNREYINDFVESEIGEEFINKIKGKLGEQVTWIPGIFPLYFIIYFFSSLFNGYWVPGMALGLTVAMMIYLIQDFLGLIPDHP